jgi:branched-chain amino acid transport system substrate-binding protein
MRRRALLALLLLAALLPGSLASPRHAVAQVDQVVRIGVLTDMSGPFSDQVGPGSVAAARLAVEDFRGQNPEARVEIVFGDHQNKPDIGLAIARRWVDIEDVSAIVDLPNSAVALAVSGLMKERNRTALASSAMTSDLTGKSCAPTTVQWVSDTWAQGAATARALAAKDLTSWYFLTVDYALGHALERDALAALQAVGGKSVGGSRHPLSTADFSAFLVAAQGSGARVLALANTGADMINAVKQAQEFGVTRQMTLAALFVQISDVHALGLPTAQGLRFASPFYWDHDDASRAFAARFGRVMAGRMPTEDHAGVYSSTLAYLRAVWAARSLDGAAVVAEMKRNPFDDPLFGSVKIRRDGRAVHELRLYEVKTPAESRGPYDYYKRLATVPGDAAFRPEADGGCALSGG